MKKVTAGYYEYKGYDVVKDDKTNTRRAGAIIIWKVWAGMQGTGVFMGKFASKQLAKEWIDNKDKGA